MSQTPENQVDWDKTIILTFATGQLNYLIGAQALATTLKMHHGEAKRVLITDLLDKHPEQDAYTREVFDEILAPPENFKHWFIKLCALEHTTADRILFLDGDCLALRNIDPMLEELKGSDFAVFGRWISDAGDWYGDFNQLMQRFKLDKVPQFIGGFIYYERNERTQKLIDRIMEHSRNYDSFGLNRNFGQVVDEVCIALAMAELGIGKVFPESLGWSVTPWNNVKVHLDVFRSQCSITSVFRRPQFYRPWIYHTAMGKWDLRYWREVHKVRKLYLRYMANRDYYRSPHKPWQHARRIIVEIYLRLIRYK